MYAGDENKSKHIVKYKTKITELYGNIGKNRQIMVLEPTGAMEPK